MWLRRLLALVVGTGWYIINLSFIYFFPEKRTLILLIKLIRRLCHLCTYREISFNVSVGQFIALSVMLKLLST